MFDREEIGKTVAWALLIHVLAGFLFLSPGYLVPDSVAVYSFLRSLVFDHDLLFYNEWAAFSMIENGVVQFKEITPVGAVANHWWIGTSILVAPAYLVAHAIAPLLGSAGGFSGIYAFTLAWASVLAGAIASAIGVLLLKKWMATWIAVMAVATTWIGMPAFWYEYRFPLGTHLAGVMVVALLLAMTDKEEEVGSDWSTIALGVVFGAAVAVRLQHVMLGPAIVWVLLRWPRPIRALLLFSAGAALPGVLQGLAWHVIYGHPLGPLVSGASLGGETWMPFRRNALMEVLFSSYHGLFTWSPIALMGLAGLLMRIRRSIVAQVALLMFIGELIANGLFDRYFWGGLSFGPRRFVDLVIPLAIGTGFLIARFPVMGTIGAAVAAAWTGLLTASAMTGRLELSSDVMPGELVSAAFSFPWSEIPATIGRSAGTLRAPALSVIALVVVLLTYAAIAALLSRRTLRPAVILGYCGFWILILALAIPATRHDASRQMNAFEVNPRLSSAIGPLLDARGLMSDELEFLVNRGRDEDAKLVAEEIRRADARIAELRAKEDERGSGRRPDRRRSGDLEHTPEPAE